MLGYIPLYKTPGITKKKILPIGCTNPGSLTEVFYSFFLVGCILNITF